MKPSLIKAHECLLEANDLLLTLRKLRNDDCSTFDPKSTDEQSFVELGSVWQAPMFEISLHSYQDCKLTPGNCSKFFSFFTNNQIMDFF